jgi:Zn ribbon nucleic-acid-binding protein
MTYRRMKACPRCGGEVARYIYESGFTRVECIWCDYMAMPMDTIPKAIDDHNRRVANGEVKHES